MVEGQAETQPSIEEMASKIAAGILQSEGGTPREEKGKFTSAQPKTEAEPAPTEAPQEETSSEEQPEIQPEPRRFKLKYKGEELEKEEPEVLELAQKGFDYTQKSQALAKEREEHAARVKAETEAAQAKYEQQLELHRQAVLKLADQEAMTADLDQLSHTDLSKAQQLFFRRQKIITTLQGIQQEQEKIAAQRQQEMTLAQQKAAKQAVEILQNEIPGWNNEIYVQVLNTGVEHGFKQEEVNAITDPRAIKVLWKARQYDLLKAKPATDKRVPPAAPKVVKPGTTEKVDAKADKLKAAKDALKKSGRSDDAVELAKLLLAQEK